MTDSEILDAARRAVILPMKKLKVPNPSNLDRRISFSRRLILLYLLFFVSGFSALMYQIAWQRMLGLFGGSDSISAAIVVGAFLLGLGVGSLLGGILADRLTERGAIVGFAFCEIGIAAFAIASKLLFYDFLFGQMASMADSPATIFLVAFIALLFPTLLMGLSLPLLARGVVDSIHTASQRIGWLYGLNTLGAAAGAFAAGCFLIGTLGYEVSVRLAAVLNLMVGAGALLLVSKVRAADRHLRAAEAPQSVSVPARVWAWCLLVFVSGFIIISLEILWFRVIGTMLQSTAYSFALVLGTFLLGDALGIIIGAFAVKHISNPRRFFLWLQGAVTLYAIASLWLIAVAHRWPAISDFFIGFDYKSANLPTVGHIALIFATIAFAVIPPAVLLGMSFPITQKAIQDDPAAVGQRVGVIQSANILGNTAGSLVTGLILLQYLGTSGSLRLLGCLGLTFVLLLLLEESRAGVGLGKRLKHAGLAAGLIFSVAAFPDGVAFWSRLHAAEGAPYVTIGEDRTGVALLVTYLPGGRSSVPTKKRTPRKEVARLYIGGHAQSWVPFSQIHGLLGLLGPLVHPDPKWVLVIGHGTGGTPYGAGARSSIERVRVVEIIAPTYGVMHRYNTRRRDGGVNGVLNDPRYERVVGDARHVLFTDPQAWDVIEADAIRPRTSLSGLLYSVEYFRLVRARLNPGGVAVQWVPTERSANSFLAAFPHVIELIAPRIMLGSDQPMQFDADLIASRLNEPPLRAYLHKAGWDPRQIGQQLRDSAVRIWDPNDVRLNDVNTDLLPKDEFYLNKSRMQKSSFFGAFDAGR